MDRASRIEEWESRPVSGGYVGLHDLADEGFTGAVSTGGAYLFMLNGRVVSVEGGSMSTFEDADATAYRAPDPALPLLFAMLGRGGEVRGNYYTDDTPIQEVDGTLTEGGFTGYLELSENVLSGDYYVVYYGGRSLAAAFVGNKGRVVTGDEAFELAADEVGIYEVTAVELDVSEVPEPPESAVAAASTGTDEDASEGGATDEEAADDAEPDEEIVDAEADEDDESSPEPAIDEAEADSAVEEPGDADEAPDVDDEPGPETSDAEGDDDALVVEAEPVDEPPSSGSGDAATAAENQATGESARRPEPERREPKAAEPDERFEEEARWREARTVPALDPDDSAPPAEERQPAERASEPSREPAPAPESDAESNEDAALQERLTRLEAELESEKGERRRLDERLESVHEERDALEAERDELAARVERLEDRLDEAQPAAASASGGEVDRSTGTGGQRVDPQTALDQTDLFVRYGSKSKPTLDTAHADQASAEEVAENLRIDSHSRFDPTTATVDGRPFDEFLADTIQYRFVSWLVEVLLYEIRETGTETGLRALYDALPEVDRAEFNGTVTATDEEGERHTCEFDVVCRNRMGKPLIVANINDSLDPATGDMMGRLVEDATEVAEGHVSIGAAFLVTASFFQPDALETAEEATRGGGFLSRDSKKSFVKLSRSGGYHLCLVEARGDDFHVAVPEF